ncbi:MAG TPA: ABC transporter ATP-binding protein [Afipia sp.]
MAALLETRVIEKSFDERRVLEDIDVRVESGEIVSLVGPSGCGKSTLLRIIAGLERSYSGAVALEGKTLSGRSSRIGFIFQEPRLLPWLTVAQNISFSLGNGGATHPRVARLLTEVGLDGYEDALPKQLSGGQAQRVSIARGLFTQPQVLLLDEPFSAVDAFTRMKLQDLLLRVAAQHGTTLVLVTHDLDEALYLGDRVLMMGANPGIIRREVRVDLPHPRDRRDPVLAETRAELLTELYNAQVI